jgi:hypothetical protein
MTFGYKYTAVFLCVFLPVPSHGWNNVGHRAIAGAAYAQLTDRARAKVDERIRQFADYELLVKESAAPADPRARARAVFMMAAYWPDVIKGDPRYYDDTRRDAVPTPTLPGFPDMKRRTNWHYVNVAFTRDGTPVRQSPVPNVLTQLKVILPVIGKHPSGGGRVAAEEDPVYLMPWLLHLVGDVHQPLHCATRFRKNQLDRDGKPMSDLGGNTVILRRGGNLHALWDDSLGTTNTEAYVDPLVNLMIKRAPAQVGTVDPEGLVKEGFEVAGRDVYSFGNETGTKEAPLQLSEKYLARMRVVALERAALGAARLAAILNEKFR